MGNGYWIQGTGMAVEWVQLEWMPRILAVLQTQPVELGDVLQCSSSYDNHSRPLSDQHLTEPHDDAADADESNVWTSSLHPSRVVKKLTRSRRGKQNTACLLAVFLCIPGRVSSPQWQLTWTRL